MINTRVVSAQEYNVQLPAESRNLDEQVRKVTVGSLNSPKSVTESGDLVIKHVPEEAKLNHELLVKEAKISTFVMNNPSEEAIQDLKSHYKDLSKVFTDHDIQAEDLEYILWATPEARCTFSKHYCTDKQERLEKMNNFLSDLKSGALERSIDAGNYAEKAANLESILTALGYRAVGPSWIKDDKDEKGETIIRPENVKAICNIGVKQFLVSSIGDEEFPDRASDDANSKAKDSDLPRKELEESYVIPSEDQVKIDHNSNDAPKSGLAERYFTKISYVAKGIEGKVAMRAHVSGSAPLSYAALNFLKSHVEIGSSGESFNETQVSDVKESAAEGKKYYEEEIINRQPLVGRVKITEAESQRFKGLLVASYSLGDYHSFAETMAGAAHYEQQMVYNKHDSKEGVPCELYRNKQADRLKNLSPRQMIGLSVGAWMGIVSLESRVQAKFNDLVTNLIEDSK